MKRIPVLFFVIVLIASGCSSSDKKTEAVKDKYEATKESLEETEKKNPKLFLTVSGNKKRKRNLLFQTVVKGTVTNTAKVASYKDIELRISFFSETGTLMEEEVETIYKNLAPGNSADFTSKYYPPKGSDSVALKIMGAKVE